MLAGEETQPIGSDADEEAPLASPARELFGGRESADARRPRRETRWPANADRSAVSHVRRSPSASRKRGIGVAVFGERLDRLQKSAAQRAGPAERYGQLELHCSDLAAGTEFGQLGDPRIVIGGESPREDLHHVLSPGRRITVADGDLDAASSAGMRRSEPDEGETARDRRHALPHRYERAAGETRTDADVAIGLNRVPAVEEQDDRFSALGDLPASCIEQKIE